MVHVSFSHAFDRTLSNPEMMLGQFRIDDETSGNAAGLSGYSCETEDVKNALDRKAMAHAKKSEQSNISWKDDDHDSCLIPNSKPLKVAAIVVNAMTDDLNFPYGDSAGSYTSESDIVALLRHWTLQFSHLAFRIKTKLTPSRNFFLLIGVR
ncbi:hypothetical protein [Ruegeria lacuscaerulensis]|uniref:hypothetical protein n=1 Tax=Ruegeria lacuscaerulensis TaxID=55218 RepID=UPI00147EE9F5|nr:hypothetical protein [Ruegeria lacuscaerulensis]